MQLLEFFDQPVGHLLVDPENLFIFFLLGEPCHANELVGKNEIGNCLALVLRQMRHAVIAAKDIPIEIQPAVIVLPKGFRQYRGGCVARIIDPEL